MKTTTQPTAVGKADDEATGYEVLSLEPTIRKIKEVYQSHRKHELNVSFEIGLALEEGRETLEDGPPFYGDNEKFNDYMQQAVGLDKRNLSDYRRLVTTYEREAFDELVKHPHISWTHFRQLLRVPDYDRREIERRLVRGKLTTRELAAAVKESQPSTGTTHGRSPKVPAGPTQCLQQIISVSEKLDGNFDDIWFGKRWDLRAKIADLPPEELNEQLVLELAEAENYLAKIAEQAATHRQSLQTLRQLVRARLDDIPAEGEGK